MSWQNTKTIWEIQAKYQLEHTSVEAEERIVWPYPGAPDSDPLIAAIEHVHWQKCLEEELFVDYSCEKPITEKPGETS